MFGARRIGGGSSGHREGLGLCRICSGNKSFIPSHCGSQIHRYRLHHREHYTTETDSWFSSPKEFPLPRRCSGEYRQFLDGVGQVKLAAPKYGRDHHEFLFDRERRRKNICWNTEKELAGGHHHIADKERQAQRVRRALRRQRIQRQKQTKEEKSTTTGTAASSSSVAAQKGEENKEQKTASAASSSTTEASPQEDGNATSQEEQAVDLRHAVRTGAKAMQIIGGLISMLHPQAVTKQ
jgi:hypothetical protein